jgi:aspartate kinase
MKVVVQKFGGTSVDSEANQLLAAERIMEAKDRGLHPVVVVSAMGREGQPYSTAELVRSARRIHPAIQPRELDLLMSCGEIISTVAMAHLLRAKGYETMAFSGGQAGLVTDDYYGHAHIVRIEAQPLFEALQDGYILFVAGFQGNTERHQITTLGAGGSDYTAVALTWLIRETPRLPFGEELDVEPLQVYKEVDGIMTANPSSLEHASRAAAQTIPQLTYDECVALSRLGAQVLQQQAAEMARQHGVPLTVRNFTEAESARTEVGVAVPAPRDDRATGIADQPRLIVFDLAATDPRLSLQISERLARERVTYYQLATDEADTRIAVAPLKYRDVDAIVQSVLDSRGVSAKLNSSDLALVSVVGEALRGRLEEWAQRSASVLRDAGVEVRGTSRDDISLCYLVPEPQRKTAVSCLHEALVL